MNARALVSFSAAALAALTCCAQALAGTAQASEPKGLRTVLEQRYPQFQISEIRPAAIPGLYEVFTGGSIIYADATGNFIVAGPLVDTRTKADLTRRDLDAFYSMDFSSLPVGSAIKTVRGNGQRRIALFEDPDCPYCRQLEQQIAGVDNLTIYTFLFPITSLHPAARVNSQAIWCATDRSQAWRDWMLDGKIPQSSGVRQ